jgi:hypothetical protein
MKKMKNKLFIILIFLVSVVVLNSCLKDNVGEDWTASLKGKMYAEVWKGGYAALPLLPVPDSIEFKFLVNIASDVAPTTDITITLGVDSNAVIKYNTAKGTNFKTYPYVDILTPTLVIKAGTRNIYAHVKVWHADLLNACDNFIAPIVITSASGGVVVSDALNQGSRLMALPIANPYSGSYNALGYRVHPINGVYTVHQDEDVSTINCSTVLKHFMGDYPYDVSMQVTTSTVTVLGVVCLKVIVHTIDPSTGSFVAGEGMETTFTGNLAYPPAPPTSDVNYYNPVTKQFVLNYFYNAAAPRVTYEILTRN